MATHPIPQLQGPFEESILEAGLGADCEWVVQLDAQCRRRELLELAEYERLCGRKWRHRPGERYHPLWKLISQACFGIHLLANGLAKSDVEVVRILQSHVDEFDGFLERTAEDLQIIQLDLQTRINYLRLPLENLDVFDEMLEERGFRHSILEYNDKIDFAIHRFSAAVDDSLKDLSKAKEAIGALWHYLLGVVSAADHPAATISSRSSLAAIESRPAANSSNSLAVIYDAMIGNVEGWNLALSKLYRRGLALNAALLQLGAAVTEMERRVGIASRRELNKPSASPPQSRPRAKSLKNRIFDRKPSLVAAAAGGPDANKPLPSNPDIFEEALADQRRLLPPHQLPARKSVPDLRLAQTASLADKPSEPGIFDNHGDHGNHDNSSNHGDPDNPGHPSSHGKPVHTPHRNSSSNHRFARSVLSRRTTRDSHTAAAAAAATDTRAAVERPSTAPPRTRTLRSRSLSVEQLRSTLGSRRLRQRTATTADHPALSTADRQARSLSTAGHPRQPLPTADHPPQPLSTARSTKRDALKSQLLHYFKLDRALEAVELPQEDAAAVAGGRSAAPLRKTSAKKKDWPLSVFRSKAAKPLSAPDQPCRHEICLANKSCLCGYSGDDGPDRLMDWSHADTATTYSLKPKHDLLPRIPTLLTPFPGAAIAEEHDGDGGGDDDDTRWDARSLITALPSIPPSLLTPESPRSSLSSENVVSQSAHDVAA